MFYTVQSNRRLMNAVRASVHQGPALMLCLGIYRFSETLTVFSSELKQPTDGS